jgi:hypothetical protein
MVETKYSEQEKRWAREDNLDSLQLTSLLFVVIALSYWGAGELTLVGFGPMALTLAGVGFYFTRIPGIMIHRRKFGNEFGRKVHRMTTQYRLCRR